ncbi:hypothetical protein RBG61_06375 [Paludicola sp. MB14-C6]|uniref:hypothetical protein n=1 Tax=Paludihabitans sp. MB14-C6 TaxID=3070656 RepID=UPI0027DE2CAD|nr:hypothetical protein [Paludicola sp. MB14-C6]WMJ24286.1 hypothetical protein RBG61_06375 [Paludicola sp. MB14-C6]
MIKAKLTGTDQELQNVMLVLEKSMSVSEVNGPHKNRNSKYSRLYATLLLKNKENDNNE